ncbi:PREDICTED: pectin acetylesterase 11-like [Ipomoea nil]|uniref:pectin acetylesterase 11-like n=1 Tax=Ipomoea nil TaxID=35883 RepID=UPI000900CC50|nr:PREDICTED: pectin acetylesterase 11-like [Ipomoea nil]
MAVSPRSNDWICLLIFSLVISVQYVNSNPIPTPIIQDLDLLIPKTIIPGADEKGAVCLDGSPPAYHFSPGKDEDASNWLIYLAGGGWCTSNDTYSTHDLSVESCSSRMKRELGSTFNMAPFVFKGIFGINATFTKFYKWNRVIIRYCDGGSFAGDVEKPDPVTKLYYRGARIFQVVVDELMAKGMKDAKNVIFAGGSAGGLGVLVHCDRFTSRFPKGVRVKCLSDSSLFLIVKDPERAKYFKAVFSDIVALHQPNKSLPVECTSKMSPFECFQPKNLVQYVKSPLFIFHSAYDSFQVQNTFSMDLYRAIKNRSSISPTDMALLQDFKKQIISALPKPSATKGFIVTSNFGHSFASADYKKRMFADSKSKTIEDGFYNWFFDKHPINLIDPNNVPFMF